MASNIPGATRANPGVKTLVQTLITGVSVPSGARLAVIMGEGTREETLVASANGGGNDGIGSGCNLTGTPVGRFFKFASQEDLGPVVSNRTIIEKNGVQLTITEGTISSTPFDSRFDARVDTTNACVELQTASLVDQGGEYWLASSNNTGSGVISGLSLLDVNAPAETWTIKCSSVRRDGYGNPIDGYARFVARGSESGSPLDGYGNVVTWTSNGTSNNNGILQFAITEGATAFREGDSFTIQTQGGALTAGDRLTAKYIAVKDINDPQFFTSLNALAAKHGTPSLENRLSLGAQLAFSNGSPGIYAMQCAPAIPRRLSYTLVDSSNGESDLEEFMFSLPLGVVPDSDSNINFFVRDPITGVESQVIPNKVPFFDPGITLNPSSFVFGATYDYSYTVVMDDAVVSSGTDGVLTEATLTTATISSASVRFGIADTSGTRSVKIVNATNPVNNGIFSIVSVAGGRATISNPGGFTTESSIEFEVLDSSSTSARVLLTDDLALNTGERLRATIVDLRDADFFDAGWQAAYESAEKLDIDIVVPLPSQTISAIFQNGKIHVETQSDINNAHERVLLIGAIAGLTPENITGEEPAAVEDIGILEGIQGDEVAEVLAGNDEDLTNYSIPDAFGDTFRVIYFYPDEIVVQAGANRITADGFFMAAAAAGWLGGNSRIEEPMTNKVLSGFALLRDKLYSPIILENITSSGITVLQPVIGGGRVIWGKTTVNSNLAEEEEISIIFIRDRIAKSLRTAFAPYIGKAETPTTQSTLYAVATSCLQGFIAQRLITDFTGLSVARDEIEPRQWNIVVAVQPTYPVNWIFIQASVGRLD